jgi:uncharacterized membrane protein
MTPVLRTKQVWAASTSSAGLCGPLGLVALGTIPAIAGALRLLELAGGPPVLPVNPRIAASPAPAVIHVTCAIPYLLVGAFQFSAALRRRWPRWHLRAGQVLLVLGLAVALSAPWMTLLYTRQAGTGSLHYIFRLLFGSAMTTCLVLGTITVRRRDFTAHRAWMMRAYALAAGAGTQVFTEGVTESLFGAREVSSGLALGAGWVINLTIAEGLIVRTRRAPRRPATSTIPA